MLTTENILCSYIICVIASFPYSYYSFLFCIHRCRGIVLEKCISNMCSIRYLRFNCVLIFFINIVSISRYVNLHFLFIFLILPSCNRISNTLCCVVGFFANILFYLCYIIYIFLKHSVVVFICFFFFS